MKKGWKKCYDCGNGISFNTEQQRYVAYSVFIIDEGKSTALCQCCLQSNFDNIVEDYESKDQCIIVRRI